MSTIAQISDRPAVLPARVPRRIAWIILLLLPMIAPFANMHSIANAWPVDRADLKDEWAGVRDIFAGVNPYSPQGMRDTQIAYYGHALAANEHKDPQGFPYPAHIAFLLAPIASLSWESARLVFLCTTIPLLVIAFGLCVQVLNLHLSWRASGLAVYLAVCSWPVMWGLRLQQPTLLIVPLAFIGVFLISRGNGSAAGVLLALSTVKPQLVFPLLLWVVFWSIAQRMWSFILSFSFSIAVLLLWTEHIFPHWIPSWIAELRKYSGDSASHGDLPLQLILGHRIGLVATALLIAWTALLLWKMRKASRGSVDFGLAVALSFSAAISACISGPMLIYNQAALFPACVFLAVVKPTNRLLSILRRVALLLVAWTFVALFASVSGYLVLGHLSNWSALCFLNPELPVAITIALAALATHRMRRYKFEHESTPFPQEGKQPTFETRHVYDEEFFRYIQDGSIQSAREVVPIISAYLNINSVLDVGSGAGAWISVYREFGVPQCLAMDGDYVKRDSLLIPATDFLACDVSQPFGLGRQFSLVQCLEVGEHIPIERSPTLIANLVRHSECVLFSAATPGQGGEDHINEQNHEFWRALFAAHGFTPYDCIRPALRDRRVERWYRHNTLLYVSDSFQSQLPEAIATTRIPDCRPIPNLASRAFRLRSSVLAHLPVTWVTRIAVAKHRCVLFLRGIVCTGQGRYAHS